MLRYAIACVLLFGLACGDDADGAAGAGPGPVVGSTRDGHGDGHGDGARLDSGDGGADGDAEGAAVDDGGGATTVDGGPVSPNGRADAGVDSGAETSTDAGSCDLSRTRSFRNDQPIVEGSFCDDIFTCVDDANGATALQVAAPGFNCSHGEDPLALCDSTQTVCQWITPGVLTAGQASSICAATVSTTTPLELVCIVWE